MFRKILVTLLLCSIFTACGGGTGGTGNGDTIQFSGQVKNSTTSQPIQGATVTIEETGDQATTDSEGLYQTESSNPGEQLTLLITTQSSAGQVAEARVRASLRSSDQIRAVRTDVSIEPETATATITKFEVDGVSRPDDIVTRNKEQGNESVSEDSNSTSLTQTTDNDTKTESSQASSNSRQKRKQKTIRGNGSEGSEASQQALNFNITLQFAEPALSAGNRSKFGSITLFSLNTLRETVDMPIVVERDLSGSYTFTLANNSNRQSIVVGLQSASGDEMVSTEFSIRADQRDLRLDIEFASDRQNSNYASNRSNSTSFFGPIVTFTASAQTRGGQQNLGAKDVIVTDENGNPVGSQPLESEDTRTPNTPQSSTSLGSNNQSAPTTSTEPPPAPQPTPIEPTPENNNRPSPPTSPTTSGAPNAAPPKK